MIKNMSQNHGPIWKGFRFVAVGVDIPVTAVTSLLKEQEE